MGHVICLTTAFIFTSIFWRNLKEFFQLYFRTNLKYKIIDYLANYLHYGDDIGVEASLRLDYPSEDLFERRKLGQKYLESKIGRGEFITRASLLAHKIVDCRFALTKILMPLLRELEFPPQYNFICQASSMRNNNLYKHSGSKDLKVVTDYGHVLSYVGNDAVHTLGTPLFYTPIQKEINIFLSPQNRNSTLKYIPNSLNHELNKNVHLISNLTRMEKVTYYLSGSEAIFATLQNIISCSKNKKVIVRFRSAYHGHVSGVDFLNCGSNHVFLSECSNKSIEFIERFHYRIAAVIVNPMQFFTGLNKPSPPGEKLTASSRNRTIVTKEVYARWLHTLMEMCNYCSKYLSKIAFVIDDIYFAFRTPELFSTNYFTHPDTDAPLTPNILVIGKGVAAGYPLSVVVSQKGYLNSHDHCYFSKLDLSKDTLSAWHGGIVASNLFLEAIIDQDVLQVNIKEQYLKLLCRCNKFCEDLNKKYEKSNIPLRIKNFGNTFSIDYLNKSLYNSRYPQYLMSENIYLGNYSTGKFNLNADTTEYDLECLGDKFIRAGLQMQKHGYFEPYENFARKKIICSLLFRFTFNYCKISSQNFTKVGMIDVDYSILHPLNKFCLLLCSVITIIFAYPLIIVGQHIKGFLLYFIAKIIRQFSLSHYKEQGNHLKTITSVSTCGTLKKSTLMIIIGVLINYLSTNVSKLPDFVSFSEMSPDKYFATFSVAAILLHPLNISYQFGFFCGIACVVNDMINPLLDLKNLSLNIINLYFFVRQKKELRSYKSA